MFANRVNMMVQGRGLDLSTTKGLNAARTLATRVTANYAKRVNAGLEASPEEATSVEATDESDVE